MSTVGDVLDRVYRDWLFPADQQPAQALLSVDVDDTTGTITLDRSTLAFDEQNILSPGLTLEVGLEWMLITSYASTTGVATVLRGYAGTERAAHTSGARVILAPYFARRTAFDAICDEVVGLSPALWGEGTATVTSGFDPVPVDADVISISSATWVDNGSRGRRVRAVEATLLPTYPPSPTGKAVLLHTPSSETVHLGLRKKFSRPTSESDTLDSLMVKEEWTDILVFGTAARMSMHIDPSRLHIDWATEFDQIQQAPAGSSSSLGLRLRSVRDLLLQDASRRLTNERPMTVVYNDPFAPETRV